MAKPRILVIDDGLAYAEVIAKMPEFELLLPWGQPCLKDGPAAIEFLAALGDQVDVVLLDMHFDAPDDRLFLLHHGSSAAQNRRFQGVAILRGIRRLYPKLPVVLLTAIEDLSLTDVAKELSGQSMTYFLDGDDRDALRIRIFGAWQEAHIEPEEWRVLWGDSPAMRAAKRQLSVLARGTMPVILEGETGTGKSFLAEHFVHLKSGRSGPFVVLDLASIPGELVAAHLFGAARGAYTGSVADRKGVFELAQKGTLFIDEIQNIPLEIQKQLLLVLQDRRIRPLGAAREIAVDVKVIASSNVPLDVAVGQGRFRSDLYMRLSPATRVRLEPLRDRPADLSFLAERFIELAAVDPDIAELKEKVAQAIDLPKEARVQLALGRAPRPNKNRGSTLDILVPAPAWQMLCEHHWPGNVRELQTVMRNILTFTLVGAVDAIQSGLSMSASRLQVDPGLVGQLLAGASALGCTEKNIGDAPTDPGKTVNVRLEPGASLSAVASSVERQYFLALFRQTDGDFSKMAELLLGDRAKSRAIRLRFNQLGLKVKEISK